MLLCYSISNAGACTYHFYGTCNLHNGIFHFYLGRNHSTYNTTSFWVPMIFMEYLILGAILNGDPWQKWEVTQQCIHSRYLLVIQYHKHIQCMGIFHIYRSHTHILLPTEWVWPNYVHPVHEASDGVTLKVSVWQT